MFKKLLILSILSLAMTTIVGCGLITTTTTESTTESTTDTTETTGTTATNGTTTTNTSLIDLIPAECSDIAIVDGWIPTWCDEFEAALPTTIVDPTKWAFVSGGGGFGNQELQYYKNADPDNIAIRDGALVITALKEVYSANNYTSTKLWTRNKINWKYGI